MYAEERDRIALKLAETEKQRIRATHIYLLCGCCFCCRADDFSKIHSHEGCVLVMPYVNILFLSRALCATFFARSECNTFPYALCVSCLLHTQNGNGEMYLIHMPNHAKHFFAAPAIVVIRFSIIVPFLMLMVFHLC